MLPALLPLASSAVPSATAAATSGGFLTGATGLLSGLTSFSKPLSGMFGGGADGPEVSSTGPQNTDVTAYFGGAHREAELPWWAIATVGVLTVGAVIIIKKRNP